MNDVTREVGCCTVNQLGLPANVGIAAERPRYIWLAFEASEVIELKQVVLDRDTAGAADFFRRVVAPRVVAAARRRGLEIVGTQSEADERLPG
jgi:hypothetical protein